MSDLRRIRLDNLDLMSKQSHEVVMNDWLMSETTRMNNRKLVVYHDALRDWNLNEEHCRELGIENVIPRPAPPVLDPVEPMPAGFWFR